MHAALLSAGIDYLTMTTKDPRVANRTMWEYETWAQQMRALGHDERVVKFLGYQGRAIANVAFAHRDDGWITRASGWQAGLWYRAGVDEDWHPTRIDVQLTGVFNEDRKDFAAVQAANAVENREHSTGGRPYRVQLISGFGSGDTLSVGSRSSVRYGRLYDKHREAPEEYPPGAWRWELETKQEAAEEVNKMLRPLSDETPVIAGLITDYYTARGVQVPVNVAATPAVLHLGGTQSDDEKSLRWLRSNVRPTVARLLNKGLRNQVEQALGLTAP